MTPRVTDNDAGEIIVSLYGQELRGWSYNDDAERRAKMLAAREYVEGWCDARCSADSVTNVRDGIAAIISDRTMISDEGFVHNPDRVAGLILEAFPTLGTEPQKSADSAEPIQACKNCRHKGSYLAWRCDACGFEVKRPLPTEPQTALCDDCPPEGYPTDKTRCTPCPRRAPHCQAEIVPVPKAALDWLFGEGAGPDGKWFGDDQDTEQRTPRKYSHAYWWRSKFRSMIPALTRPQCATPSAPSLLAKDAA